MIKWFQEFFEAKPQTKYFALNWAFYGIAIIASTVYCYGRLDYVRSYRTDAAKVKPVIEKKNKSL